MDILSKNQEQRFGRLIALPEMGMEAQVKIKRSKVLVIGAGGLGSAVLPILASTGVGNLGIVEYDEVELTNLQRQILYSPADVGTKKIDIAAKLVKSLNPELNLTTFDNPLNEDNSTGIISQFDYVLDCTDNFKTRFLINDICEKFNKTLIYASVSDYEGQVMVLHHHNKTSLRDFYPDMPKERKNSAIIPTLPQIIGSIQANEAIKAITGTGELLDGKLLLFNVLNYNFQIVSL